MAAQTTSSQRTVAAQTRDRLSSEAIEARPSPLPCLELDLWQAAAVDAVATVACRLREPDTAVDLESDAGAAAALRASPAAGLMVSLQPQQSQLRDAAGRSQPVFTSRVLLAGCMSNATKARPAP